MRSNGHLPDFLDSWLEFTANSQSPPQFRLWSGLSLLSSALERRVWAQTGRYVTYPNLYVMLVGAPGIGKQIIEEARQVLMDVKQQNSELPAFHIASDSATRASLMDELFAARQDFLPPKGQSLVTHPLALFSEELQVLIPLYDGEFISRLNRLFNCPDRHRETRRTGLVRDLIIPNPCLNLLMGAQPAYMADTFPENAWATGVGRRFIMVYSSVGSSTSIFEEIPDLEEERFQILSFLSVVRSLWGHSRWEPAAFELAKKFDQEVKDYCDRKIHLTTWPVPDHPRLVHYNRSRTMMLTKLAIIAGISERLELVVRQRDVERALGWLLAAEDLMPDIFREMRGRSDREVMDECQRFVMALWARNPNKREPVHTAQIIGFLTHRVHADKVDRIFGMMERSDLISRVAGAENLWVPRPLQGGRPE